MIEEISRRNFSVIGVGTFSTMDTESSEFDFSMFNHWKPLKYSKIGHSYKRRQWIEYDKRAETLSIMYLIDQKPVNFVSTTLSFTIT